MVALLMASAQARRVLAPLCRMLGIEASVLTAPGSVATPIVAPPEVALAWNLGVVLRPPSGRSTGGRPTGGSAASPERPSFTDSG